MVFFFVLNTRLQMCVLYLSDSASLDQMFFKPGEYHAVPLGGIPISIIIFYQPDNIWTALPSPQGCQERIWVCLASSTNFQEQRAMDVRLFAKVGETMTNVQEVFF